MHCWFVLFVMEGVSVAERERERWTALGKIIANQYQLDSCSWLKNDQATM